MSARLPRVLFVVAVFAVVGVVGGVAWEALWTPPVGVVFEGEWLLEPVRPEQAFSGTGLYVLIAGLSGLVVASAIAALSRGRELLTLGSVLAGSLVAAWVMLSVGQALGPDDPRPLAAGQDDFTAFPADLRLAQPMGDSDVLGPSALLAFPIGAMFGVAGVYLLARGRETASPPRDAPRH